MTDRPWRGQWPAGRALTRLYRAATAVRQHAVLRAEHLNWTSLSSLLDRLVAQVGSDLVPRGTPD